MRIISAGKYAASFFKSRWTLEDYPVEVWPQWSRYEADASSPEVHVARIIGWAALVGAGPTPEAALADLRRQFESYRQMTGTLPRPGWAVAAPIEADVAVTAPAYDDHLISGVSDLGKTD